MNTKIKDFNDKLNTNDDNLHTLSLLYQKDLLPLTPKPIKTNDMGRPIKANETTNNIKVVQSYIMSNARYNFNITEKRILYRLVEIAQSEIEGRKLKDNMFRLEHNLRSVTISMAYSSILSIAGDGSEKNHSDVKVALKALSSKLVEVENTAEKKYWCSAIVSNVYADGRKGYVQFDVAQFIWNAILDFSKGYRQYELITAMKLRTPYAMRFYELMSGQTMPYPLPHRAENGDTVDYATLDELRALFGVKGKYKKAADLCKRIIEPSKAELDRSAPYSFNWQEVKEGRKIVGYRFYPIHNAAVEDVELAEKSLQAKVSGSFLLDNRVYDYLKFSFDFKADEINKNKKVLVDAQNQIPDFLGFLGELKKGARLAQKPKAYVIGAIKRKLKELPAKEDFFDKEAADAVRDLANKFKV